MGHEMHGAVTCRARLDPTAQAKLRKDSPKTQAAKLRKVLAELCMRQSRARIRNQQLLRDFSGLQAQLASLAAKTDALRRKGWVSGKPPSAAKNELHPAFQMGSHSEERPFTPFELAPAEEAHGQRWPGFGARRQGDSLWPHLSPSMNFCPQTGSEYSSQAWLNPCSLQRSLDVKLPWLSPGQGGRLPESVPPWVVSRKAAVSRRRGLPQGRLRPDVAQAPQGWLADAFTAGDASNGEKSRGSAWAPVLCNGGSEKVRSEGCHLIYGPHPTLIPGMLSGSASALQGPPEQPLSYSDDDDGAGSSISSLAEMDSGHWVAERALEALPRRPGMKAKPRDAILKILNEGSTEKSSERLPGQLEREETLTTQGSWEAPGQGRTLSRGEEGDGDLGGKGGSDGNKGEDRAESPGLEPEQTTGKCGAQEVEGCPEGGLSESVEGLRPGPEEEDGGATGEREGRAGEGNELHNWGQDWGNVGEGSVEGKGEASPGTGALEGGRMEGERGPEEGHAEGKGRCDDDGDGAKGGESEGGGDEEQIPRSQEGPRGLEEDADSTSGDSVQGPHRGPAEQDHVGGSQTPSLQNESAPAASVTQAGTESISGEEEESEADSDVEAALAPWSSKPDSRDPQRKAAVQRLQELCAGSEAPSTGNDVQDNDDFYD